MENDDNFTDEFLIDAELVESAESRLPPKLPNRDRFVFESGDLPSSCVVSCERPLLSRSANLKFFIEVRESDNLNIAKILFDWFESGDKKPGRLSIYRGNSELPKERWFFSELKIDSVSFPVLQDDTPENGTIIVRFECSKATLL